MTYQSIKVESDIPMNMYQTCIKYNSEMISTMLGGLTASYTFNIFTGKRKKKKREELLASFN